MVFTFQWGPCSRFGLTFCGLAAWPELILFFFCPAWPVGGLGMGLLAGLGRAGRRAACWGAAGCGVVGGLVRAVR